MRNFLLNSNSHLHLILSQLHEKCTFHAGLEGDNIWKVSLDPLPEGGPYTITASADGCPDLTLREVLVGDVWVCAGQSNMKFRMDLVSGTPASLRDFQRLLLLQINSGQNLCIMQMADFLLLCRENLWFCPDSRAKWASFTKSGFDSMTGS